MTRLMGIMGATLWASNEEMLLEHLNRGGRVYEVRVREDGTRWLWHKGHQTIVGKVEEADHV